MRCLPLGATVGGLTAEARSPDVVLSFEVVRSSPTIAAARPRQGFTLVEVLVAMAIIGLVFTSVLAAYLSAIDRSEWSGYSLAAQSIAAQGIEQARSAKWDPQAWPVVDDLGPTNFVQVEPLDITSSRQTVFATNYISITTVSANPLMRQIQADCVWTLASRARNRGPFTNTAVSLRAPDQ